MTLLAHAGTGFATATLLPLLTCASGALPCLHANGPACVPTEVLGRPVPPHLRESAGDLVPGTPEAVKLARQVGREEVWTEWSGKTRHH